LLVTDAGLAKLPITATAVGLLKEAGLPVAVFSDVQSNPVESNVEAGIAAFRKGNHDGVIAFGGGSGQEAFYFDREGTFIAQCGRCHAWA